MSSASSKLGLVLCIFILSTSSVPASDPGEQDFKPNITTNPMLTLDGGGLRGIIIVEILNEVENRIKKAIREYYGVEVSGDVTIDLADYFKAVSGSGSGAWIASYIASKCGNQACQAVFYDREIIDKYGQVRAGSMKGLEVFFEEFGRDIYGRINTESIRPDRIFSKSPVSLIPGLGFSRFPSKGLRSTLEKFLGTRRLDEVHTILLIPAYDLNSGVPVLFAGGGKLHSGYEVESYAYFIQPNKNPRNPLDRIWEPDVRIVYNKMYKLVDVVHGASAMPTVHEAHRFTAVNDESFELYCMEASFLSNNPTLQTLVVMSEAFGSILSDVAVLSIGTGVVGGTMSDMKRAGAVQWFGTSNDFFNVVMTGGSELIQAQLEMFFYFVIRESMGIRRGQYLRIQTLADEDRTEGIALQQQTDPRYLPELKRIGKATAERFVESIDVFVSAFIFDKDVDDYSFDDLVPDRAVRTEVEGASLQSQ